MRNLPKEMWWRIIAIPPKITVTPPSAISMLRIARAIESGIAIEPGRIVSRLSLTEEMIERRKLWTVRPLRRIRPPPIIANAAPATSVILPGAILPMNAGGG